MTRPFMSLAGLVLLQAVLVSGTLNISVTQESTETSITLTWNNMLTYTNYSVEDSIIGNQTFLQNSSSISFTFDNLKSGHLYTFIIIGYTSDVNTTLIESDNTTIDAATKPFPPQFLIPFNATETTITLTWDTTQGSYNIIYHAMGDQQENETGVISETTHTIDQLDPGRHYTFYVVAIFNDLQSNRSDAVNDTTVPSPASDVIVAAVNTQNLNISWISPNFYDTFIVYVDGNVTNCISSSCQITTTGNAGMLYAITIATVSGSRQSTNTIAVEQNTIPNPPTDLLLASASVDTLNVTWTAPANTQINGYDVFVYVVTDTLPFTLPFTNQTAIASTEATFDTLSAGVQYRFVVVARSGEQRSEQLEETFYTIPNPPTHLLRVNVSVDTMKVTWTAPANTQVDGYDVFVYMATDTSPFTNQTAITSIDATFDTLSAGVQYRFVVVARSGEQRSEQLEETFYTMPDAVQGLSVSTLSTLELSVFWNTKTNMQNHFVISASNSELTSSKNISANGSDSYSATIGGLEPGYTFDVQVFAVAGDGYTESVHVGESGTTNPWKVANVSVSLDGTSARVIWEPYQAGFQDSFVIRYRPILRDSQADWIVKSTSESEITLDNLFPGEEYEFKIYPISNHLEGDSQFHEVTATIAPLEPITVTADPSLVTTDSVILSWGYNLSLTHLTHWDVQYLSSSIIVNYSDQTKINEMISGLESGETYIFDVFAVTNSTYSQSPESVVVTVRPVCLAMLVEIIASTTNENVAVEFSRGENIYDKYIFTIYPGNVSMERKKGNEDDVVFTKLNAGQEYNVSVVADSKDIISDLQSIAIWTRPNAPEINPDIGANYIELNLEKPLGTVEFYNVSCGTCNVKYMLVYLDAPSANFSELDPFKDYTFEVVSYSGPKKSEILKITYQTGQKAPSIVRNVTVVEIDKLAARVTWLPPKQKNGDIKFYFITFEGRMLGMPVHDDEREVPGDELYQDFLQLIAGYTYTFFVKAQTVEYGPAGTDYVIMKTYSPSLRFGVTTEQTRAINRTVSEPLYPYQSIVVEIPDVFSDEYGAVVNYAVIVATNPQDSHTQDTVLPGWKSYNDGGVIAYQPISNCSGDFFIAGSQCGGGNAKKKRSVNNTPRLFTVGTQDCLAISDEYCNGYLTPETAYYIKLRAFTTGGFSDTEYSVKIVTVPKPDNTGLIVGVVFGVLIIGAVFALAFIILKRNRFFTNKTYRHDSSHNMTPRTSMRRVRTSRKIKLSEFQEHYRLMAADSDFRFAEEYEDLREVGRDQPCTVAELPVNRGKNRFTNILPYDHSRVKLLPTDDEEGSDYINSNYMPGFSSKREYIVTQGPLPSTRDDFWRMMWEQNCRNLVMLTRCVEKSREKCDQYWPQSSEPVLYGDLQVAALNESRFPEWTITEFKVSLGDQSRQVRHFHFTAWPDFGVPEKPQSLVKFVRTVRGKLFKECGPILVHCSAGVGRSGTFIALDRLLQQVAEEYEQVDVFGIVSEMRMERVWMVQTEQQYICIHQCLLCVLDGREEENIYQNVAHVNVAFEAMSSSLDNEDDEGINVEIT